MKSVFGPLRRISAFVLATGLIASPAHSGTPFGELLWNEMSWEQKVVSVESIILDLREIYGATIAAQSFRSELQRIQSQITHRPEGRTLPQDDAALQSLAIQRNAVLSIAEWFTRNAPSRQLSYDPNDKYNRLGLKLSISSPLQQEILPTAQAYLELPTDFDETLAVAMAQKLGADYRKLTSTAWDRDQKKQILRQVIAIRVRINTGLPYFRLAGDHLESDNGDAALRTGMITGSLGLFLGASIGFFVMPAENNWDVLAHTVLNALTGSLLGVVGTHALESAKDKAFNAMKHYQRNRPVRRISRAFLDAAGLAVSSCEKALLKI